MRLETKLIIGFAIQFAVGILLLHLLPSSLHSWVWILPVLYVFVAGTYVLVGDKLKELKKLKKERERRKRKELKKLRKKQIALATGRIDRIRRMEEAEKRREEKKEKKLDPRAEKLIKLKMEGLRKLKDADKSPHRSTLTFNQYIKDNYVAPLQRELNKVVGQELPKRLLLSIIPKLAEDRLLRRKEKHLSFLLVGPTGVGKTELVKRVAEALKGVGYRFFRIDANQLKTPESVQSLFGAPRGYVGSDSVPLFIQEAVKSGGKMVILIDEIEKAHPDFFTSFMTLLDEGEVTYNTTGERIPLKHSLIFITSNAKADRVVEEMEKVESEVEKIIVAKRVLKELIHFPPEILGRINYVIPFLPLSREQYIGIIQNKLLELELSSPETALADAEKLYRYFEKKGVLERGVREVVRTLETFKFFPEELERVKREVGPTIVVGE
jgi:ATP-dependent Clp protease ATP-binding subunit ClpA